MSGHLIIDLASTTLSSEEIDLIEHPQVGGIIFFSRNFENLPQITSLIKQIKSIRSDLIMSVDQEGGRVQRFSEDFTVLAPLAELIADGNEALLVSHAKTMVTELHRVGIDLSFTPVLDRNIGANEVIGDRSFSADPTVIVWAARIYMQTMRQLGMPSVGKHFPGHGAVSSDSHLELPVDQRTLEEISATDMQPFSQLAKALSAMMPAHILFPAVDDYPTGFSRVWLQDILRTQLQFEGVIFSDCLTMRATEKYGDYSARAELALQAGCDVLLVCNHRPGVISILDSHGNYKNSASENRIKTFKNTLGVPYA